MSSPFEKAFIPAETQAHHTSPARQITYRDKDARLDRRERAAQAARRTRQTQGDTK